MGYLLFTEKKNTVSGIRGYWPEKPLKGKNHMIKRVAKSFFSGIAGFRKAVNEDKTMFCMWRKKFGSTKNAFAKTKPRFLPGL
jgi:hypothetical protein